MTKIYSNAPKDNLRCCVGHEIMKRKILNCAAVLRPLDAPSTLWKYGRVLSHSAILCITKKEYLLVEYTSTNLAHINLIGGFTNKESEIGPYFEYRGFIFHYISPIQQPKKIITIRDLSLKMAYYMCKKPYDVFTNNCHQARYLTMKHYGMKSHDPFNIKYNILFQGVADYFTHYDTIKVKKNLDYDFETKSFTSESTKVKQCSSTNDLHKEKVSKSIMHKKSHKGHTKSKKTNKSRQQNHKGLTVRCSSTQDISKLGKEADKSKEQLFSHNIHLDDDYSESSSLLYINHLGKFSESSSSFLNKEKKNSFDHQSGQHFEFVIKKVILRRCNSNTHIPKIKNPYRHHAKQSNSSNTYSENSSQKNSSESSSPYQQIPHPSNKKNIFGFLNKQSKKSESLQTKKFKLFNAKKNQINYSASENIPEFSNMIHQSPVKQKKR